MDSFDDQIEGQLSIEDIFEPPERLFAVSRIFARARKEMTLAEQKTFVYALSEMRFTEEAKSDCVKLDKKTLARILGITTEDTDNLSTNLYAEVRELPRHSYIEINEKDLDLYSNGFIITAVTRFRNVIRLRFNREYIGLFTGMSRDYITMWSSDIFQMKSKRSVQFYEFLRQKTDTRKEVNSEGLGVRAFKELFDIPKDGKGSYMRATSQGGFDRTRFEQQVIQPLCDDLKNCRMIHLIAQPDGKLYEKVKNGNRVAGYRFYWTFVSHPPITSPAEVQKLGDRLREKDGGEDQREYRSAANYDRGNTPIRVVDDEEAQRIIESCAPKKQKSQGSKKNKNSFSDFENQRQYNDDFERLILHSQMREDMDT